MKKQTKIKLTDKKITEHETHDLEKNIPSLIKMREYFEKISKEEFKNKINQFMKNENLEKLQLFLYYIMLFRDLDNIHDCLNDEEVPVEFLENLIIFIVGYCSMFNLSGLPAIDFILIFISEERLLELINKSDYIRSDKLLMFHILTRLDKKSLDTFFDNQENLIDAISSYYKLPEEVMATVITRNRKFFDYIMMRLLAHKNLDEKSKKFIKKFEKIIKELKTMGHIIMKYHSEVDLNSEGKLPFNERDMNRISFLVNTIKSMPNSKKASDYFAQGGVFADEHERQIVFALVTDPLLKNIFPNKIEKIADNQIDEKIIIENKCHSEKNYFDHHISMI